MDDGCYSAPRGVILPAKVAEWQAEIIRDPELRPGLSPLAAAPLAAAAAAPDPGPELA